MKEERKLGHMARRGTGEIHTGIWKGILREIVLWEGLGFDESIILKWTIRKWYGARTGLI